MKNTPIAILIIFTVLSCIPNISAGQDLMDVFGEEETTTDYTYATFKTTRVVSGHSVENPAHGVLLFMISHHFGKVNSGAYDFFGLDQATIRLGLEYGINDFLSVGIGRNTYQKTYDGFLKAKVLRQSRGARNMPVTVTLFSAMDIISLHWQYPERKNYFSSRLSFVNQVLIARKFNDRLSLQVTPTFIHKNLVSNSTDDNDTFAIGAGGRFKLSQRISLNAEYFYVLPGSVADNFENPLAIGFDIETGGHVFQLHFSNAQPMFERAFITETTGKWANGDIYFGFNISRVFTIKKPAIPGE
jgi:opacity protein-like surface antigen